MRFKLLIILFILSGLQAVCGQAVNFEDGFEDGDFSNDPAWGGNTGDFIITDIDDNSLLQLNAEGSGTSYLSTPSENIDGSWEFYIRLDFAPSGGNRAYIFLTSNTPDLGASPSGYAIRAGESGSDDLFHLVRFSNGSEDSTLISGTTDISSGGEYRVKVTRDSGGNWILETGQGYDGKLITEGTGQDNSEVNATHFGILLNYTSTRSDKFYFDFKIDLPPFTITGISVNDSEIDLAFNRNYDQSTVQSGDFLIDNGFGSPGFVSFVDEKTIRLGYGSELPSGKYTLSLSDIEDENGEIISPDHTEFYVFDTPSNGDVVINEFMYDPPAGLEEYVELINSSDKFLNLQNWQIGDDSNIHTITFDTLVFEPASHLVISRDTSSLFNIFGSRPYVEATVPFLNNNEDGIRILDDKDMLVDTLFYTSDWGGDDVALERRSPEVNSNFRENWSNSPDPLGGTPGEENKLEPDNTAPEITNLTISSSRTIQLAYDEKVSTSTAEITSNYTIDGITVSTVQQTAGDTVEITLSSDLENAVEYNLSIQNISDIFGNTISKADTSITYYKISPVEPGDIAINEFMYDPPENSTEYIEIYNYSDKSLDLDGWILSDNRDINSLISSKQFILPPESYIVVAPDNSLLQEFADITLVSMGSSFPALNNGGDQIVIKDSAGVLLDSLEYSSDWGGEEVALERISTALAGIHQANWGNSPRSIGTPGSPNKVEPDVLPPALSSLVVRDDQHIDLQFSETLDPSTTENPEFFSLSGEIPVADAKHDHSSLISLFLDKPLRNNTLYEISVSGVSDLFGNSVSRIDTSFTFYKISEADSGDVFINEFMFIPPSGRTEYIELRNSSTKSINLQGWTFSDNRHIRNVISDSEVILPPEGFIVIAPDNSLQDEFPDISIIEMGSNFPSLNNSSDDIVIHKPDSTVIDSLRYTSAWGGDETALERRTTKVAATYQENWGNTSGTPGFQNTVGDDNNAPQFQALEVVDASTLQLIFSERLAVPSATNIHNYSVSPETEIGTVSINADTVTLHLNKELVSGRNYRVTVTGLEDLFGNKIDSQFQEIDYLKISKPAARDLVINEILYKRSSDGGPEFIELYNRSDKNFILDGWTIADAAGIATLTGDIRFPAGEYLVLTDDQTFAENNAKIYHVPSFPSLNDTGDILYIRNENRLTIDSLHYKSNWGDNLSGVSLERKDPGSASNDASNWVMSEDPTGITPGRKNAGFEEDDLPPDVIFSKHLDNGKIEVHFNEFIALSDEVEFILGSNRLDIAEYNPAEGNKIVLSSAKEKRKSSDAVITVNNLSDVRGNKTESANIAVSQPVRPGDLVINEIMYNPLSDSEDNMPDQSEYIELRNITDHAISLEGILLHDAPDENNNLRILTPVRTESRWIPAQDIVLIYADQSAGLKNSKIADFFDLDIEETDSPLRVDRTTLSLASTGDAIYIADSTGTTIDSVFYDESWQNPNLIDTRGIALERINPGGPGNDAANWGSSINEKGGTPGSENSIYQKPEKASVDFGISFSPNPFSPDNDGYEDNLFINYSLDASDYLIKIRIYDRYGRLVRKLEDGKPAGFEGSIIWDGRRDDGSRNRIGIYIVVFEAYDSSTGKNKAFKETVVLARRL